MSRTARRTVPSPLPEPELRVLSTRLLDAADRPLPDEDELDAFVPVAPRLHEAVRRHLEPFLGRADSTFHDTQGPVPIDVAMSEPDDGRDWGACFTVGASARAMPETEGDRRRPSSVELFLRLPESCFRYWDGVVLEPFEGPLDAVVDALGELGRLPHRLGVRYVAPQIVATPDLVPIVPDLPFAGVLLRDATTGTLRVPPLRRRKGGAVTFLTATFLHPSEVRALIGPRRADAAARIDAAGIDELLVPDRRPVL